MSDTFGRFTELSIIQYGIFNKKSKTKYQKRDTILANDYDNDQ